MDIRGLGSIPERDWVLVVVVMVVRVNLLL
jgi:hypothetical protein